MAKPISFSVGADHTVDVKKKGSKYIVQVDGSDYQQFKLGMASSLISANEDFPVTVDGVDYVLAVRGNRIRMAAEGKYIDNGEEFVPQKPLPKWFWVFGILNIAIPVISLGGALNFLIGFGGAAICASVVNSKIKSSVVKALICTVITAIAWILWFMLIGAVALLDS